MRQFSDGPVYLNFPGFQDEADDDEMVRTTYGPASERLAALEAEYDRENLFRLNQYVAPAT